MVASRTANRPRINVTDEEVSRWIEEDDFERRSGFEMNKLERDLSSTVPDDVPPHGNLADEREEGVFRALLVQLNGMSTKRVRNKKAAQLQWLVKKYDVQLVGLGEVGVNWSTCRHKKRLLTLLPEIERSAKSVTSHNSRFGERHGIRQQGGVGMLYLNDVIPYCKKGGKDFRHLGRWVSVILSGSQHHRTRIVQCYGVRPERSTQTGSVHQQHIRYMQEVGIDGYSPRQLFESDLLNQLRVWRAHGDRLILMMDANEHVLTGRMCRQLCSEGIDLHEITKSHVGSLCPNTYIDGSQPIDGVWATPDLTITGVKWLPFAESPGDHRSCIFEFTALSAIGKTEKRIVYPACRRLTSRNVRSAERYTEEILRQFEIHNMEARLDSICIDTTRPTSYPPDTNHPADKLDQQVVEIQRHCEKSCRKIYRTDSECSPAFSLWHKRAQVFKSLISMKYGGVKNTGLLCRKARRLGIEKPRQWTVEQLRHGRAISKAWKRKLKPEAPILRKEHLSSRLVQAKADGDKEKEKAIRDIIDREASSSMWSDIKWTFSDNGGRSAAVTRVERVEGDRVVEYREQSDIERVVREETQARFSAAASSPFCQGTLGEELGYVSDTATAAAILNGTYEPPSGTSDSVRLLLDEIGRIGKMIGRDAVRLTCTKEEFQLYWKRVSENTSSSFSGIHFGHYVTAAKNDRLASFFAKKISYIAQSGRAPSRWGSGLNVLLEKVAGVALVNKLRAILLMEADMNMHNRLIFGDRMMEVARENNLVPDEQYAEKESDSQDGVFLKRLLSDISRQLKIAMAIISADAANCYDRIAHSFASLVFQSFGVCVSAICSMLCTIQYMKFFLRTGFGESPGFMTAVIGTIIHGMCQGNTGAPAAWSVVSAILIAVYKRQKHKAILASPISGEVTSSAGVLFVDDVDLTIMEDGVCGNELFNRAQSCTTDWSHALNGSGGTLKAEKSFGYIVDYEWNNDGSWEYSSVPDSPLLITLPDNTQEPIELLDVNTAQVTLGIATRPTGDDLHHLRAPGNAKDKWKSIATRAEVWVNRLRNGHLPPKFAWVSYRFQLWASVRYGLGVLAIPLRELGELTKNFAFRALPHFGVNRNIKTGWRYLHGAFSGCGLLDLATESSISRLNTFLQHWGSPTPVGKALRASVECLQLEVGCRGLPFKEPFSFMGHHTTHSWVRCFWECIDAAGVDLEVDYPEIPFPRENDLTIMQIAFMLGYSGSVLEAINRCRLFVCAIFLSDVTNAQGTRIDYGRCGREVDHTPSSSYRFPTTRPSDSDWKEWQLFWERYCLPDGSLPRSLGKWIHPSHKSWVWMYDPQQDRLCEISSDGAWLYYPTGDGNGVTTRRMNIYGRTGYEDDLDTTRLVPTSVTTGEMGSVHRLGIGPPLARDDGEESGTFWDFLRSWKGEWMWESARAPSDMADVVHSIENGTAVFVTDGSYNRKTRSDLSAAGWVLYCRQKKKILLTNSFHEVSRGAGSYRGELLGLLSIHLFLAAIESYFDITCHSNNTIACDNLGALNKAKSKRKKIPSGSKHGDIRRVLRSIHRRLRGRAQYIHVYGHQDTRKGWENLSLLEKLNCICDNLAKTALLQGTTADATLSRFGQRLPLEASAVFYGEDKITSDCGEEIRFQIGRKRAREFYLGELDWKAATFDAVDWVARDRALCGTTDMFRLWLCKQCSSFCATGKNMGRWFGSEATQCPNCKVDQEDAYHLLHCPDTGRTTFFQDECRTLQAWLNQNTEPDLAAALSQYISRRGEITMRQATGTTHNRSLLRLADHMDVIGWDNLMVGMVSTLLRPFQHSYLLPSSSMLTADDWLKQFLQRILHITHGQWIYRNVSRHHSKHGLLKDLERQSLLREIEQFLSVSPEEVPEESRFLLEIDFQSIRTAATECQSYWVHAMRAAVKAGRRVQSGRRKRRRVVLPSSNQTAEITIPLGTEENNETFCGGLAAAGFILPSGAGSVSDKSNKRRKPD